jgi:capsular exopolysaccharide synthesis family protein
MSMSREVLSSTGSPEPAEGGRATIRAAAMGRGAPDLALTPHDVDWRRYVSSLKRFKWLVLGVTVVGTAAGIVATRLLRSVLPAYETEGVLWIDQTTSRPKNEAPQGPQGPIGSGQLFGSGGWVDLLRSGVVLERVARDLRLYLAPNALSDSLTFASFDLKDDVQGGDYTLTVDATGQSFQLWARGAGMVQQGALGDSVGAALGFAWVPPRGELKPGRTLEFTVTTPSQAAVQLAKDLNVSTDLDGSFVTVSLRGADPVLITDIVNAVADRCVVVAADLKREKLKELTKILGDQMEHARAGLRAVEAELKRFRVGAVLELSQGERPVTTNLQHAPDPVFASYFDMRGQRDDLRHDREAITRVLSQPVDSRLPLDALELIPSVQHSTEVTRALADLTAKQAELRALLYHYTDKHPPVQNLKDQIRVLEQHTLPTLLRALVASLAGRESDLSQRVDSATRALRQIPPLAIEEARLERDVTSAELLFTNIQGRYEEARLAEVSSLPDLRLLGRAAVPHLPVTHYAPFLILLSFVGSFGVSLLGAVVLDRVDRRIRYPEQVTEAMGLTILGVVPHLPRAKGAADGHNAGPVIEALRGIRLSVLHAHGAGPVLITVSSPGRADGKSFVASNLALAFADAGHRTLLIDGDVRRGGLHRALGAARKPGLTDALAGRAGSDQVVQPTASPALSFIGCGTRTQAGAALISAAGMPRLLGELRGSYSVIVVDSPPLAAGVDAYVLGTLTGAMLLVLRTGVSDRELAEAKLDVLDRLPIRVLGAVLNDVRADGVYRYYSYYLAGYELKDEIDPARHTVLHGPK